MVCAVPQGCQVSAAQLHNDGKAAPASAGAAAVKRDGSVHLGIFRIGAVVNVDSLHVGRVWLAFDADGAAMHKHSTRREAVQQVLGAWHARMEQHDCLAADPLVYVATYGAPGFGQAWRCAACGRQWSKVGDTFYPAEDMAHILTEDDVR